MSKVRVGRLFYLLITAAALVLDRLTKWQVQRRIELHDGITIIPGFFRLIHLENPGAAFGFFSQTPTPLKLGLLITLSIVALVPVSVLLWRSSRALSSTSVGLALILGGAIGNLWDRLLHHRVTDFLLFYYRQYEWPAFNFADSAIVVGATLLVVDLLFNNPPQEPPPNVNAVQSEP
jgi:signal peptidase II